MTEAILHGVPFVAQAANAEVSRVWTRPTRPYGFGKKKPPEGGFGSPL